MRSLRIRFLITTVLSIGLALMATAVILNNLFHTYFEARTQQELQTNLLLLTRNVGLDPDGQITITDLSDPRFSQPLSGYYWQAQIEGADPIVSPSFWATPLSPTRPETAGLVVFEDIESGSNETLYAASWIVTFGEGANTQNVFLTIAFDHSQIDVYEEKFAFNTALWLAILGVALIFANWLQIRIGLRPVDHVHDEIQKIHKDPKSRLPDTYPTEIQPLASAVNELMETSDQTVKRARESASDLAHGLKTPLTILRAISEDIKPSNAQLDRQKLYDEINIEINKMEHFVERELAKTRDSYNFANKTPVLPVVDRLHSALIRIPKAQHIKWSIAVPETASAPFDEYDLTELLGNLLDNAIRHTHDQISISAAQIDQTCILSISDNGEGVDANEVTTILDRGTHRSGSPESTGIGLSIVRDMCQAHNCELTLNNQSDGGLRVCVSWAC